MCGRYTLTTPPEVVQDLFHLSKEPECAPRFNLAPSQEAPAIRRMGGRRQLDFLRWGLVPPWADEPSSVTINARAETASTKPWFRASFTRRRCLVPADGFYEWRKPERGRKQPFYFQLPDGQPFAFAGLWESWGRGEQQLQSFTFLTTKANHAVGQIHGRMPVILRPEAHSAWLDPDLQDRDLVIGLLEGGPMDELVGYPVSTYVNNPANDSPYCIVSQATLEEIA